MKLLTYSLTIGETINTGNFNNVRYEVGGSIDLSGVETEAERDAQIEDLRVFIRGKAVATRNQIKGA